MARLTLLALFLALVWSVVLGAGFRRVDCSGGKDFVTDRRNCRKFFKCTDGVATQFKCKINFFFDPVSKKCAEKSSVDCEHKWDVKLDCSGGQKFVADPTDCTRYYNCNNGVPTILQCSEGKFFNPNYTGKCVTKRPADCQWKQNAMKALETMYATKKGCTTGCTM